MVALVGSDGVDPRLPRILGETFLNLADDGFRAAYETKNAHYFSGARSDFVAQLPDQAKARILEIGCGHGETGELALAQGKCGEYVGIEISENAAAVAGKKISSVLVGNVETIEFPWVNGSFDAVIMSEVLEHLVDPWRVVKRISPLLRNGALVMASSPNVSQYKLIVSLTLGHWKLSSSGLMDRTHLRWFTPESYRELFENFRYCC